MCKEICSLLLSRPARGAWIEIPKEYQDHLCRGASRPARGAWIEIWSTVLSRAGIIVAPREGRVD